MARASDENGRLERLLNRLGEALRDRDSRSRAFGKVFRWFRLSVLVVSILYLIWLLIALPLLLRHVGERNLSLAFCLYVPLQIWLLPLIPLFGIALLSLQWRLLPFLLLAAPVFALWPMGYRFGGGELPAPAERPPESLTILSYNRGQHLNQSLQPFKDLVAPDLLVYQESTGRAPRYLVSDAYAEFSHFEGESEFVLLSKHPITAKEPVIIAATPPLPIPIAARFEIDWNGRPIALYTVHMTSPRDVLRYYSHGAALYGVIGLPGTPFNENRKINQKFWDDRIDVARALAERIANDSLPVIVAGDFNAPQAGYIHGIFNDFLDDSHKIAGSGFGFSFPGTTRNPLSLGGPWMRIDHIFSDPEHWTVQTAIAEKDRPSQHRAIAAVLKFTAAGASANH